MPVILCLIAAIAWRDAKSSQHTHPVADTRRADSRFPALAQYDAGRDAAIDAGLLARLRIILPDGDYRLF